MSDTTKPECGATGIAEGANAGTTAGIAVGAATGSTAVVRVGIAPPAAPPSYKATPVPAPAVLHATTHLSASASASASAPGAASGSDSASAPASGVSRVSTDPLRAFPPPILESCGTGDVLALCRALDRPLEALSSLIEVVAGHPYPSDDLRALLERVGNQAAALQALVQSALTDSTSSPVLGPMPPAKATVTAGPAAAYAVRRPSTRDIGQRTALRKLTEREHEVLALLAEGLATAEIAHRLGITSATVRSHVQNILTRLGVCNRRQAAALLAGRLPSPTRARLRAARRAPDAPRRPADLNADPARPQLIRLTAAAAPPQKQKNTSMLPSTAAHLTRREVQVLRCLAAGLGRSEIAERLYVSPHTARTHIQRVLTKLGVHSALAAMAVARDVGLTPAV